MSGWHGWSECMGLVSQSIELRAVYLTRSLRHETSLTDMQVVSRLVRMVTPAPSPCKERTASSVNRCGHHGFRQSLCN